MTKKALISVILFLVIAFASTFVFANDNTLSNAGHAITNVVTDAGTAVRNGAENLGNNLQKGAQDVTGAITNMGDNNDNNGDDRDTLFTTNDNNGDYTATRTNATNGNFLGMNTMTWTWFILAVAAILIVALVWYYSAQNDKATNYDND